MHHRGLRTVAALAVAAGLLSPSGWAPAAAAQPDPIAGLTLKQEVGQLFMVGSPATAAGAAALQAVRDDHIGNVFLSGRSHAGRVVTRKVVGRLTALVSTRTTAGLPLLVATDQEGGEVQVLSGPGFDAIPSALAQSRLAPAMLQADADRWGRQLRKAGVNMDLGPVSDVVPSARVAARNPPIGQLDREYGYGATSVRRHANAFQKGMREAGAVPVAKHFPGLGKVDANTDTASGVTDRTTTASSPAVGVYRTELASGLDCVMVSSAYYARIDPRNPAVFSRTVVGGLLRGTLGFNGVVMSDDLSAAVQVQHWSPGRRAVKAIAAGVDIVLVSAAPQEAPAMVAAVLRKARAEPAFAATVTAAAQRVVALKQRDL